MKLTLKILRIPTLVGVGLLAATSAQSINRLAPGVSPVTVAASLTGAPSLVVWQSSDKDGATSDWARIMQAQYAVAGLRVQVLATTAADVRQVVGSQPFTASAAHGLMLFDHAGQLRMATVKPEYEQLSTAEVAAQALIAKRELPAWIASADNTRLSR